MQDKGNVLLKFHLKSDLECKKVTFPFLINEVAESFAETQSCVGEPSKSCEEQIRTLRVPFLPFIPFLCLDN